MQITSIIKYPALMVAGVIMTASTISPEDATSNLAAWAKYFGVEDIPDFFTTTTSDALGMIVAIALIAVATAIFVYDKRNSNKQGIKSTSFSSWNKYIDQAIAKAQIMLNKPTLDIQGVEIWRTNVGKALRTSLGAEKSQDFLECCDISPARMYHKSMPESVKHVLSKYKQYLEKIRSTTTPDEFIPNFIASDLDFFN